MLYQENTLEPKKMLHNKWRGPRGRPQTRWIDQIRKDKEMIEKNWEEYKKTGSGEN